jgi:hypothetical protein
MQVMPKGCSLPEEQAWLSAYGMWHPRHADDSLGCCSVREGIRKVVSTWRPHQRRALAKSLKLKWQRCITTMHQIEYLNII